MAAGDQQAVQGEGYQMTMKIWVAFWVAVFLLLDLLDQTAQAAGDILNSVMDEDWFIATITVLNVVLVLKMVGWL